MALSQVVYLKPEKMKIAPVRLAILNALRKQGTVTRNEMKKTVRHWDGARPDFKSKVSFTGADASVVTETSGNQEGQDKWHWLNEGTSHRWAVMSSDWQSKTTPDSLSTGPGQGRVLIRGSAMISKGFEPMNGIEPRNWSAIIQENLDDDFVNRIIAAQALGMSKLF